MPRFLADENFRHDVLIALQKRGIDIKYATKGIKNGELFKLLVVESRVLLTHDADFSDSKRYPAHKTKGIVIVKIHPPSFEKIFIAIEKYLFACPEEVMVGKVFCLTETKLQFMPQ